MASKYQPKPYNPNLVVRRSLNSDYRSREYLEPEEVAKLLLVAGDRGRHRVRDTALLLLMFRHGLRVSEAVNLRWDAVTLKPGRIAIARVKGSDDGNHPLLPDEVKVLQELREAYPESRYLFPNERGGKLATGAIARIVQTGGELAELPMKVHPHMLRHSCGYWMANQGLDTRLIQDWLGHRNIQHTVRYTRLNPERFNKIDWALPEPEITSL